MPASATIRSWTGSVSGNWSEPSNWDPAGPLGTNDLLQFKLDDDAHRTMTNDIVGLVVQGLQFGFEENDHNYQLYGNAVQFRPDGYVQVKPDGSSTVTIDCPLIAQDGLSVSAYTFGGLIYDQTAILNLNGSITIMAGSLGLSASSGQLDEGITDGVSLVHVTGAISGSGNVRVTTIDNCTVGFEGPQNNTFTGTLLVRSEDNSRTVFGKTAGYVVTNALVISNATGRVEQTNPNQVGLGTRLQIIDGGSFELAGNYTLNVGSIVMSNRFANTTSPILNSGSGLVGLLGGLYASTPANGQSPIIQGQFSLSPGDHTFVVEATNYAGLNVEAQLTGPGGFTKSGNAAMILTGNNNYVGTTTVADGVLDVRHDYSLGSTVGNTVIGAGGLTLRNVDILNEGLIALGKGTEGDLPGSVLTIVGTASWSGQITLSTNLNIVGGDVTLSGIISGSGGLGCFNGGTIELAGILPNTYTGRTLTRCPLLLLGKNFGNNAFAGPLEVGGGFGGAAEVRWNNSYQTPNTSVTLFENGVLNLNHQAENFGPITFNGGVVNTGTGFAIAENTITANPAATNAIINGNLSLAVSPAYLIVSNGAASSDLVINAAISGVDVRKQGEGTLTLTAANPHTGYTLIENGILEVQHPSALGTTAGNTIVWPGATLRLGGMDGMLEGIQLEGAGFQGTNGALQVISGGTMYGGIWLSSPATINSLPGSSLSVAGSVGGTGPLTKTGSGTLSFSGATANTYSGGTVVTAGTLQLLKNQNIVAAPGNLTVGPASLANPATVRCFATGMLPSGAAATVNASSLLDLNGNNQTLAQLNLNDGGDVQTGIGSLGFTPGAALNVGTLNSPVQGLQASASVSGKITLPANDYLYCTVLNYGPGALVSEPELAISAAISGSGNLIKYGGGTLRLTGNNSFDGTAQIYSGEVDVMDGVLIAGSATALGGPVGATYVANGASLALINQLTFANETLILNSSNNVALDNRGGSNVWTGPIQFYRNSAISVNTDWSLTCSGVISGSGGLYKNGAGALTLAGAANNTFSGDTFVNDGILLLGKSSFAQAIPHNLTIGTGLPGAPPTLAKHLNMDQIQSSVTVNAGGLLDVGAFEEYAGYMDAVRLNGGGDITSGSGTFYLADGANLIVNPMGSADPATISGKFGLFPGTHRIIVTNGVATSGQFDLNISAPIGQFSTTAGVSVEGSGRTRFGGTNTFTGITSLTGGTLAVDGAQPQSQLQHLNGRLEGNGIVGNIVFGGGSGARTAPGSSPGILTCSNFNATASAAGRLEIELNGLTPGTGHDQLNVRGSVNLTSLSLQASLGFSSSAGQTFVVINNDGNDAVTGNFTGLAQNASTYIGGELFQINYAGGTGNDVVLTRLVTPAKPALTIERVPPASVRLLWPTNDPLFSLQSNSSLDTTNWIAVLPPPIVIGTNNCVTNSATGTQNFYRLSRP